MTDPRTCRECGHRMTTGEVWKRMVSQLGWRIACPGCGWVHDIPTRERLISSLCYAVAPGLLSVVVLSRLSAPAGHAWRLLLLCGLLLAFATLGSWLAARRLRLG